jgi:hypothetical protein
MPKIYIFDFISVLIATVITMYLLLAKNPHEKGTNEYLALRVCRISLALIAWSFDLGLTGLAFGAIAFIFAVIGIIKGKALYGSILLIASVLIPLIGMAWTVSSIFQQK